MATAATADAADDCFVALAEAEHAFLISGDQRLLRLAGGFPIRTAAGFLAMLSDEAPTDR